MKYKRLSKEQLEELHKEFINFLASQTITATEWEDLKKNKPEVAEAEIDVFCDLVWEGILKNVEFLEHFSENQIHLFCLKENKMHLIAIRVNDDKINLLTDTGYKWLQQNLLDDTVSFYNAEKDYSDDKNLDKFKIIEQGASITKGELYNYFAKLLEGYKAKK